MNTLPPLYWIGGSPCAGKSSIAGRLAERYGWAVYNCDEAFYRHAEIVTAAGQPTFHRLMRLSSEDLWITRPVAQQVAEELATYREEFSLILDDLRRLPAAQPVVVEGAALLPELVFPLLTRVPDKTSPQPDAAQRNAAQRNAIWIVPTEDFQRRHYQQRDWWPSIVRGCSDPLLAFDNWMRRDASFARIVQAQAGRLGLPVLVVDGRRTLEENLAIVDSVFHPP